MISTHTNRGLLVSIKFRFCSTTSKYCPILLLFIHSETQNKFKIFQNLKNGIGNPSKKWRIAKWRINFPMDSIIIKNTFMSKKEGKELKERERERDREREREREREDGVFCVWRERERECEIM